MSINPQKEWWQPNIGSNESLQTENLALSKGESDGSAAPFWALIAFTFILLISPQSFLPVLGPLRLAMLAAALSVMMYILDRFVRRRPILVLTPEIWIAILLFGWAVITIPLSYWPGGSITSLTGIYAKTMVVFILLTQVVTSLRRMRIIIWGLSLMAVPIALIAFFNLATSTYIVGGEASAHSRILGYNAPLTENPNDLALTLNLILPLSVALFFNARKPLIRAMLLVFICLYVVAIVATFSRGGFLTLAVTGITYMLTLFRRGRRLWVFLAIFIVIGSLPFLPSGYVDRVSTISDIQSDETGSSQARWRDMVAAGKYVLNNPLIGAGLGMDALALNEVRGPLWTVMHNVYLQYALDLGLPGMVLFIMLLVACIKATRYAQARSAETGTASEIFFFAEGIRISLIAFAVAAMFHPVGYHFSFYYIAGLAVAIKSISLAMESETIDSGRIRQYPFRRMREQY